MTTRVGRGVDLAVRLHRERRMLGQLLLQKAILPKIVRPPSATRALPFTLCGDDGERSTEASPSVRLALDGLATVFHPHSAMEAYHDPSCTPRVVTVTAAGCAEDPPSPRPLARVCCLLQAMPSAKQVFAACQAQRQPTIPAFRASLPLCRAAMRGSSSTDTII